MSAKDAEVMMQLLEETLERLIVSRNCRCDEIMSLKSQLPVLISDPTDAVEGIPTEGEQSELQRAWDFVPVAIRLQHSNLARVVWEICRCRRYRVVPEGVPVSNATRAEDEPEEGDEGREIDARQERLVSATRPSLHRKQRTIGLFLPNQHHPQQYVQHDDSFTSAQPQRQL